MIPGSCIFFSFLSWSIASILGAKTRVLVLISEGKSTPNALAFVHRFRQCFNAHNNQSLSRVSKGIHKS